MNKTYTQGAMAERMGLTRGRVSQLLKLAGLKPVSGGPRVYSEAQVQELERLALRLRDERQKKARAAARAHWAKRRGDGRVQKSGA